MAQTSGTEPNRTDGGPGYFGRLRTDVLAMVPSEARDFLSVGCGAGRTEAELLGRGGRVVGIEMDPAASAEARRAGLEVLEGDAASIATALEGSAFDCLIYADVLEHIADPLSVLRPHVGLLRSGGSVVVSVPNFRHYSVFWALFVRGVIPYADEGIFDRTHVRITTRRLVQGWFRECGLAITEKRFPIWSRRNRLLARGSLGLLNEFVARQVIVRGVKG